MERKEREERFWDVLCWFSPSSWVDESIILLWQGLRPMSLGSRLLGSVILGKRQIPSADVMVLLWVRDLGWWVHVILFHIRPTRKQANSETELQLLQLNVQTIYCKSMVIKYSDINGHGHTDHWVGILDHIQYKYCASAKWELINKSLRNKLGCIYW